MPLFTRFSALCYAGRVYGNKNKIEKHCDLTAWGDKNDYLNVGVLPEHIKFEVGTLVSSSPNQFSPTASGKAFFQGCQILKSLLKATLWITRARLIYIQISNSYYFIMATLIMPFQI